MSGTQSGVELAIREICCPRCGRRYRLPESLVGPGGARVRCPGCAERFDVPPGRGATAALTPPARGAEVPPPAAPGWTGPPARPGDRPPHDPATAAQVVEEIGKEAAAIARAAQVGRLFSEARGPLLRAFDEYRRRAGEDAAVEPFHRALRERWGIDLFAGPGERQERTPEEPLP